MFPPEIIDHVLSFLQRDHATLKVCARVHPSLSKLAEKHFYRHLTVQNFQHWQFGAYDHRDLLKRIVDNPNISNHARTLRIKVFAFRDYQALESILPLLTQLRVILLAFATKSLWKDLRESFRTTFTNCLRLPTLTHVELSNIDGLSLSALDHSSSLKWLSLSGSFCYLPPASRPVYPPLDFLDLCNWSTPMEIIAPWLESRNLRALQLRNSSLEQSSRLLGTCANTLTTLHIDVPLCYSKDYYTSSNDPAPISLSFSCLRHLAQLTVQTSIWFDWRVQSCLPTTMRFLDTLPSPPVNLVHLIIRINIRIDNCDAISDTDWSPLLSFPYFDVIPRVELQVCARKAGKQIPSVELLGQLKQDPHLMQLGMHQSFLINAVEEVEEDDGWFYFDSD